MVGLKTVLGSAHVVEQLKFSKVSSILIFAFDIILGSFLTFWGPNGIFLSEELQPNIQLFPFVLLYVR